ncbi:hypothetical protein PENTCL1PPCAC_27740, partial [Pristionchus entomophagus]
DDSGGNPHGRSVDDNEMLGAELLDISESNPFARLAVVPKGKSNDASTSNHDDDVDDPQLRISAEEDDNLHVVLAMNEAYSELIDNMIEKAELALRQNRSKQNMLEERKKIFNSDAALVRRKIPVTMFMPPFFKDQFNMCPPLNEETKRKMASMMYDPLLREERKWTASELRNLHQAVRQSIIDHRLIPINGQRELIQEKIHNRNALTTQKEISDWHDNLEALNRKIDYERKLPDKLILTGDYSKVDWASIAMVVFKGSRTPDALRLKWCNEQSPQWNQAEWTVSEVKKLNELATKDFVSWTMIADKLGTRRTPWQCFEKYKSEIASEILKREWTQEEDERLLKLVESLQLNGVVQWDKVTYHMAGRTRQQCRTRYRCTLDKTIKHGRWTDEEDLLLMCSIGRYGAKEWVKIAKGVPGRNDRQCRERWVNVLDRANRSEEWTMEEDEKLLYAVNMFGKGQWAKMSCLLPGRNQRACKARFRSLLTTKMRICATQLSKIREAQASRKGAGRNNYYAKRSDATFKEFNQLTGGNDETGENFCNEARSAALADKTRWKRPEPEVRRVVEEGLQGISKKYEGRERRWSEMSDDDDGTEQLFNGIDQQSGGGGRARKEQTWLPVEFDDPNMTEEEKCQNLTEALCQLVAKQDQISSGHAQEAYTGKARDAVEKEMRRILFDAVESRVQTAMTNAEEQENGPSTSKAASAGVSRQAALEARVRHDMESAADAAAHDMLHPTAATTHAAELLLAEVPRLASIATPLLSSLWSGDKVHSMDEIYVKMEEALKDHREYLELREVLRCLLVEPLMMIYSLEDDNRKTEFLTTEFNRAREQLMGDVEIGKVVDTGKRAPAKTAKAEKSPRTKAITTKGRPTKGQKKTAAATLHKEPPVEEKTPLDPAELERAWDAVDDEEMPVDWMEEGGEGVGEEAVEEEQPVEKAPSRPSSRAKKAPQTRKKTPASAKKTPAPKRTANKRKDEIEGDEEEEEEKKK